MEDFIRDMWGGPGHFRFYLQPLLALVLGIRDGINDAKRKRPPYLFALIFEPSARRGRLQELLKQLTIPLALAVGMSMTLQLLIRGSIRPGASIVYAALFVALPYVIARSLTNRVTRHLLRRPAEA